MTDHGRSRSKGPQYNAVLEIAKAKLMAQTRQIRAWPILIGMSYLVFTYVIFIIGPMNYPVKNWFQLTFYIFFVFAIMTFAFIQSVKSTARASKFKHTKAVFIIGAAASLILLIPSCYYYTGNMPWHVVAAFLDQRTVYMALADNIEKTEGVRAPIIILRSLFQPFVFAVVPLSVLHWRKLSLPFRFMTASTVACTLIFSILRGTDREVADLFLVIGSAFIISTGRGMVSRGRVAAKVEKVNPIGQKRKRSYWKILIVGTVSLVIAAFVFAGRKEGRMGTVNAFCFMTSGACADYSNPLVVGLNDRGRFAASMATAYLTNGYYGLSLSLEKKWEFTGGLGHSAALMRVQTALTGQDLSKRTYQYRNFDEGWPMEYFWSTMLTSLANDVGFWGAAGLMGVFAWVWGRSWIDAVVANNDCAAVVFCLAMFTVFYFPANLQLLQVLEGYATGVFWLVLWVTSKVRMARLPR